MDAVDEFLDDMQPGETGAETELDGSDLQLIEDDKLLAEDPQQAAAVEKQRREASPEYDAKLKAFETAMIAERRKRQELEAALHQKQEEEKPFLGEEYEQRFQETEIKFRNELTRQKLDLSEAFARDKYSDFEEKLEVFATLVQENPALYQQMVHQSNPAEFAYKAASAQQKLKEMGDPNEYEQKLRQQITAELEEKYNAKLDAETKKRQQLPGTLSGAKGATGIQAQTWAGPTDLKDILG